MQTGSTNAECCVPATVHCNDWVCQPGLIHVENAEAMLGNSDADCCELEPVHCNDFACAAVCATFYLADLCTYPC
eukprot:COSAG05_NODE_1198_length_5555_cov_3.672287_12_plen_75_part_00